MDIPERWKRVAFLKLPLEEQIRQMREDYEDLKHKNQQLEERIENLRTSRRVLMTLLEKVERDKSSEVSRLEKLIALERRKKYMVHKSHPLWKSHVQTFEDMANEHRKHGNILIEMSDTVEQEADGIRENAKSIREEFYREEAEAAPKKKRR